MILYIHDHGLMLKLQDAEHEDWVEEALAEDNEPFTPHHLEKAAREVFAQAGVEIPDNAIFKPKLWHNSTMPDCVVITTTPGEAP